jgi:hypothetical protein
MNACVYDIDHACSLTLIDRVLTQDEFPPLVPQGSGGCGFGETVDVDVDGGSSPNTLCPLRCYLGDALCHEAGRGMGVVELPDWAGEAMRAMARRLRDYLDPWQGTQASLLSKKSHR